MTTNTVYLNVEQNLIDSDSQNYNEISFIISEDYIASNLGNVTVANGAGYVSLPFGPVVTSSFIKILSEQAVSVKINGGSEIYPGITALIIAGQFDAIQVSNASGYDSNVQFEFYGSTS